MPNWLDKFLGRKPEPNPSRLPSWAVRREDGVIVVDPDIAYPVILKALQPPEMDQYWLECVAQIVKLAIQDAVLGTDDDPNRHGKLLTIHVAGRKDRWGMPNFPPGKGILAATKGLEARAHYGRIRDALRVT